MNSTPRWAPDLDSTWYVVLPGKKQVQIVTVIDVTFATVELETKDDLLSAFGLEKATETVRYATDDLRWLEQL